VTSVVMQGTVHVTPEEIIRRSGIKLPVTLDLLKREYLYMLSKTSPWIDKVHLMTAQKGTVTLGVVERKPVALVRMQTAAKIALVDAAGVFLPLDPRAALTLPLVSGLADSIGEAGIRRLTAGDCERMNNFLGDAVRLDSTFARRITQVHFMPDRTVHFMLSGCLTAITLDENDISERLQRLMQVWETLEYDSLPPSRINLNCRNLAFVTMATAAPGTRETAKKKKKIRL
jgi:cell division septal protein FtsQ